MVRFDSRSKPSELRRIVFMGVELSLDQFFHDFKFLLVQFAGDRVGAVDPAAQVDEFATFRAEREERLIGQPFERESFFANGAVRRLHFELADAVELEVDDGVDELEPPLSLDFAVEPLEPPLSAFAALVYESER